MKPTVLERFEAKYIPEPMSGCWIWIGAIGPKNGYGYISIDRVATLAHRFSYVHYRGPITSEHLDHLCRVRCCVNPDHLEQVTMAENIRRGASNWATRKHPDKCPRGHVFPDYKAYAPGKSRTCLRCQRETMRVRRAKAKAMPVWKGPTDA